MRVTNNRELPEPFYNAVRTPRLPQRGRVSITELIEPAQLRALKLRYYDQLEQDCSEMGDIFFGNAVHEYLAKHAGPGALVETTLEVRRLGWAIHGTPDHAEALFVGAGGMLTDWKTTRVRALKHEREEWTWQTNLYAWLLRQHGYDIGALQVWAFLKDFDGAEMARDPGYPRQFLVKIPQPLWTDEEAEAFLLARLQAHQDGARGIYAPCTDTERWKRPATWAVTKHGNVRATKADFPDEASALAFAESQLKPLQRVEDWYRVERRESEPLRCARYCIVAGICTQWQQQKPLPPDDELIVALEDSVAALRPDNVVSIGDAR